MIIGIDIDDVILNLVDTWLKFYNKDFNDTLKRENITDWDVSLFVKPEAKNKIYNYIKYPKVFLDSPPVNGAIESISYLSKNHRIVYITANNPNGAKEEWLKKYNLWKGEENFIHAYDKSLISTDILVDDKFDNCVAFKKWAILVNAPWNAKYLFHNRADNWEEIIKKINEYLFIKYEKVDNNNL